MSDASDLVVLRYSVDLTEAGTFYFLPDGRTIRAVFGEAGDRIVAEFGIYFRKGRPGALHVVPETRDYEDWRVEPAVIHKEMVRMTLLLTGIPEYLGERITNL